MTRVQAWQEIVEKVKSRLSKWKSKTLSIGGRLTLLKSVLGSIPVFHMSIFKVPSKVLHILESIRSHFFNGHDPGSKKASWVKWNNVLTDKKRGGLGVSSLFALNRGLMIKWVWKFLSQKDSLWTKVIVAIHGVGGKIHSEWTSTGKSCWLSILSEVRSLQRKGMYVFDYLTHKMGNGESTKFWLDHWHTRGIFKDIFPRLYALESSKDVTVSSKIGDTSLVCSFRRIPRGGIEQNQFDSLVELVRSVTIVPSADRWNWNLESTGIFSVASARRRIDEICLPNIGEETRWVKCVPIKINVLAWKIKTDALPTRFNISRRGIDIQDMSCPICDNAIESTDHLFFRCGLVRDIANKVLSWWNLDHANLNSYAEWKSWLVSIRMDSKLKKMFEGVSERSENNESVEIKEEGNKTLRLRELLNELKNGDGNEDSSLFDFDVSYEIECECDDPEQAKLMLEEMLTSISECFSACFHFDINMVISAPTDSGKMVLFELCILRLLSKFISQDGRFAHTDGTLKTNRKSNVQLIKKLKNILDPAAGDWPFVQAHQMAVLAMDCCDMIRQNRHDLASDVRRVLEPLGVSCRLSSFRVGSEGQSQIPHYFVQSFSKNYKKDNTTSSKRQKEDDVYATKMIGKEAGEGGSNRQ
ncbi:RNA-directed DNA polymerase, eukaryota, reverse transcriptase zinc-binding domain protein [Tanacetum coccineum]